MIKKKYIACKTCRYGKDDSVCCPFRDTKFQNCLVRTSNDENYIHHKYPNHKIGYFSYKYLYWEPIDSTDEFILTDKDFEL